MGRKGRRAAVAEEVSARGLLALWFVAGALVALAAVPAYIGNRVEVAQDQINDVLLPASNLSSRLSLLSSRQMTRYEAFMLSRDGSVLLSYVDAISEEDSVYTRLGALSASLDLGADSTNQRVLGVRERLAQLSAATTRWHLENQRSFDLSDPSARRAAVEQSRRTYTELQQGIDALDVAIQAEVRTGRRRMTEARELQTRITLVLAVLALGATLVVGLVGWRLKGLTDEARIRRREAVRARREIDALLEATGDGVLGIDLHGRCIALNRAGAQLLGYTERDVQGKDFHDTLHFAHEDGTPRPRDESTLLRAVGAGEPIDSDGVDAFWRKDRTAVPVRWSARPLVDGLDLRGSVLTFSDMTEIRRKEEELRHAIRQREDVVSIVSHDLRNPLGVVFGATDILLELPLDDEGRKRQAEIIGRAARRMSNLIEDLLDVSRIQDGMLVVRRAPEDVAEILREAADLFHDQAERKGLVLTLEARSPGLKARLDRDRLLQALANLLDNAVRLTPDEGRIALSLDCEGDQIVIRVSDTGPGIPPEVLEHVFDRYWQKEDGSRGSVGLGLTIVKGVVDAHAGEIEVTSTLGEGTTFTLRFPAMVGELAREGHA